MRFSWEGAIGGVMGFILGYAVGTARADYCDLWAREQTRIDITTAQDFTTLTSTQSAILEAKAKTMLMCRAMDMKPLLEGENSDEAWSLAVYQILIAKAQAYAEGYGTAPATETKIVMGDDNWKEQCRAEYKTWDETTGTVVRKGNPERVRCPCGTEVQCGGN